MSKLQITISANQVVDDLHAKLLPGCIVSANDSDCVCYSRNEIEAGFIVTLVNSNGEYSFEVTELLYNTVTELDYENTVQLADYADVLQYIAQRVIAFSA